MTGSSCTGGCVPLTTIRRFTILQIFAIFASPSLPQQKRTPPLCSLLDAVQDMHTGHVDVAVCSQRSLLSPF